MGLLEDLSSVGDKPPHPAGGHCAIGRVYSAIHHELGIEVSSVFAAKVRDYDTDLPGLIDVLAAYGHDVGKQSITRHRRGDCLCQIRLGI